MNCEIITLLLRLSISAKLNMRWFVRYMYTCGGGLGRCDMLKLWSWNLVVNKCVVNTWYDNTCVVSCELYNNLTGVYLEKNVYAQC